MAAARAWWTFRVFGHDRVAVLDGGSARWKKEGRPVAAGRATPAAQRFAASYRPELVADLDRMPAILERPDAQVVNARPRGRFAATQPQIRPGLRGRLNPGSPTLARHGPLRADGRPGLARPDDGPP